MELEFHPLAEVLPLMSDGELDNLADDIRKNGQILPIYLLDGKILDGRNRYMACMRAGIEPSVTNCEDDELFKEPAAFVESLNLHRRQMSPPKRAEAIKELRKKGLSYRQIGAAVGVDATTAMRTVAHATVEQPSRIKGADGKERPSTRKKTTPRRKHFEELPDEDAGELSEEETTEAILDSFCSEINSWAGRLRNTKLSGQQVTRCRAAVNSLLQELI